MIKGGKAEKIFAEKLRILTNNANRILDIGTPQRFAKELKPYESWFDEKDFVAAGYEPEMKYGKYNCDLHADIENLPFEDESFDAIICLEVLECVSNPFKAAAEIARVLRPKGTLLLTMPFMFGYIGKTKELGQAQQGHDKYPDYWRFTHEGLHHLLKPHFDQVEIKVLDGPLEVTSRGLLRMSTLLYIPIMRKIMDVLDRPRLGSATCRHLAWGVK